MSWDNRAIQSRRVNNNWQNNNTRRTIVSQSPGFLHFLPSATLTLKCRYEVMTSPSLLEWSSWSIISADATAMLVSNATSCVVTHDSLVHFWVLCGVETAYCMDMGSWECGLPFLEPSAILTVLKATLWRRATNTINKQCTNTDITCTRVYDT